MYPGISVVLISHAAGCCLKERGRFKNINGNRDCGFNKRLLQFVALARISVLHTSAFFLDDFVLLGQFSRLLESLSLIYVLARLDGNRNLGPRVASKLEQNTSRSLCGLCRFSKDQSQGAFFSTREISPVEKFDMGGKLAYRILHRKF